MIASLRDRLHLTLLVLLLVLAGSQQAGAEMTRGPVFLQHGPVVMQHGPVALAEDVAMADASATGRSHHEHEGSDHCAAANCPACGLVPLPVACRPGTLLQQGFVGRRVFLQGGIVPSPWRPPTS
jgi:hypothetical protein